MLLTSKGGRHLFFRRKTILVLILFSPFYIKYLINWISVTSEDSIEMPYLIRVNAVSCHTEFQDYLQDLFHVDSSLQLEHFLRRLDRFLTECGFHEEREKAMLRNIQVLVSKSAVIDLYLRCFMRKPVSLLLQTLLKVQICLHILQEQPDL